MRASRPSRGSADVARLPAASLLLLAGCLAAGATSAAPAAAPASLTLQARLVEQTACRLDVDRFLVSFALRTIYASDSDAPVRVALDGERVIGASFEWVPDVAGTSPMVQMVYVDPFDEVMDELPTGRVAVVEAGTAVTGRVTAWVPLSRDGEQAGTLWPGDYRARFSVRPGGGEPVQAPPLRVRIPDPSGVQECPDVAVALEPVRVR